MFKAKKSNQEGIAVLVIVLVIAAIAVVSAAGYFVYSRNNDSDNGTSTQLTSSEKKAVEAECRKSIDDKDFCKFASNIDFGGEYRMTLTSSDGSMVTEIDGDNSSTVMTSGDGSESKFIYLNGATYTYDNDEGVWLKYTNDLATDFTVDLDEEFNFDDETVPETERETYESKGKEACGNLTCFKYQIVDPTSPDTEQYVWFDDDEYKLRRFQIIESGQTSEGTIEYVEITISEPSPVREFTQPEGVPSEEELQEYLNSLQ